MRSRIPRSPGRSSRTRASSTTGSCSRRGPTSSSWTSTAGIGVRARAGSRTGSTSTTSTGRPGSRTSSARLRAVATPTTAGAATSTGPYRPATRCSAGPSASPRRATSSGRIRRPREVYEPAGIDLIADLAESCAGPPSTSGAQEAPGPHEPAITIAGPAPSPWATATPTCATRPATSWARARGRRAVRAVMALNRQLPEPRPRTGRRAIGEAETKFQPDAIDPTRGPGSFLPSGTAHWQKAETSPRDHRWTALPLGAESRR